MLKNIFFQITSTLIAISVLIYLILHTASSFENEIEVSTVYYTTMELTHDSTAYIFRDEAVLTYDYAGDVIYSVDNGEKISINENVASVINNSTIYNLYTQAERLLDKIEYIEKVIKKSNNAGVTVPSIDSDLQNRKEYISVFSAEGDLKNAIMMADESLFQSEVKYCLLYGTDKHEEQKESLEEDYNKIMDEINSYNGFSSDFKKVYSEQSGYFYKNADGYESVFTSSAIENINGQSFDKLKNSSPVHTNNIGKIAKNSKWYIAFELDTKDAITVSAGNKYSVYFKLSDKKINMKLEKRIDSSSDSKKIIVMSSNELYDDFNFSRKQAISITSETYSGLAFPSSAVRTDYDSTGASKAGVYVLDETVIKFKTFPRLMEKNGYVLCSVPDSKNISVISDTQVSLFDAVITEGTNLYHNKVIKNVLTAK